MGLIVIISSLRFDLLIVLIRSTIWKESKATTHFAIRNDKRELTFPVAAFRSGEVHLVSRAFLTAFSPFTQTNRSIESVNPNRYNNVVVVTNGRTLYRHTYLTIQGNQTKFYHHYRSLSMNVKRTMRNPIFWCVIEKRMINRRENLYFDPGDNEMDGIITNTVLLDVVAPWQSCHWCGQFRLPLVVAAYTSPPRNEELVVKKINNLQSIDTLSQNRTTPATTHLACEGSSECIPCENQVKVFPSHGYQFCLMNN